jgi:hypothetical protein
MTDFEPKIYIHGSKLRRKAASNPELNDVLERYEQWRKDSLAIEGRNEEDVNALVELMDAYKGDAESVFDSRPNSAQEVLQPSIIEEFFEYLFCSISTVVGIDVLRQPAAGFIDLVFNPKSLGSLSKAPEYTIRRKDHDFVIGAVVELGIRSEGSDTRLKDKVVIPAIAVECKRYLERNMLDECAGTAEKVKRSTPYCKYYVVAEYLKMDDASPEMSLIDEIYILRKQRNSARLSKDFVPNPISPELVWDLYTRCVSHLTRIWWNPDDALIQGRVFNR